MQFISVRPSTTEYLHYTECEGKDISNSIVDLRPRFGRRGLPLNKFRWDCKAVIIPHTTPEDDIIYRSGTYQIYLDCGTDTQKIRYAIHELYYVDVIIFPVTDKFNDILRMHADGLFLKTPLFIDGTGEFTFPIPTMKRMLIALSDVASCFISHIPYQLGLNGIVLPKDGASPVSMYLPIHNEDKYDFKILSIYNELVTQYWCNGLIPPTFREFLMTGGETDGANRIEG